MNLTKQNYKERLIDKKITRYLNVFGAICIEGPKWCGKTWTSLHHSQSVTYMTETENKNLAAIDPKYIFTKERPQLIDEWQLVPSIWDSVRHECDSDQNKGKFILTGSTTLTKEESEGEVYHSGAGRIAPLKMYTMSLYESGDSTGEISITDMIEHKEIGTYTPKKDLISIAKLIIRGGWPENISISDEDISIIPKEYIESIIKKDIHERKDKKRDSEKMRKLLKSLARNESSTVGYETIVKDIMEWETEGELIESRKTVQDYISVLDALYLTCYEEAYSINYRSSKRVGKTSKRHLVDPSLSASLLNLTPEKLLKDLNTFGLLFEALVERDLRIYADYLDGKLYHFRDNSSGDEVDAIMEFKDGEYAAIEIKLGYNKIEDAKTSLKKFYDKVERKPIFMCIILGECSAIIKDKETGIYILPITALKP